MLSASCSAAVAYDYRDFLLTKAVSAISKKDYDRAVETYSEALGLRSDAKAQAEILSFRATAFDLADKAEQAEADYTAAIKLVGESDPSAYRYRGYFYYHRDRPEPALADFEAGARLFPDNGAFPHGAGLAFASDGKFEEAVRRYDQAIELDATSGEFMLGRAEAYNRWGQPQRALEDYDKALELGGLVRRDKGRLRSGRGYAHLKLKNYDAAIEDFNQALDISGGYYNALKWRGIAFEKTGDTARAVRDYEAALKLNPSDGWLAKSVRVLRKK